MNHATTRCALPELTAGFLRSSGCLVDNVFADLWKQMGMRTLLMRCGFKKRSGVSVDEVMYCLLLWVWSRAKSMSLFAVESLRTFCDSGKDVLYEAMNREDWDWRRLNLGVACAAVANASVR